MKWNRSVPLLVPLDVTENITLAKVVSSTSDGAATQGRFNKLLQEQKSDEEATAIVENKCGMHMGVNLRVAQIDGITSYNKESVESELTGSKVKRSKMDSFVQSTAKLIGDLGVPDYCHGVHHFHDYLKLKVSATSNAGYYETPQAVKLERQIGSRYYTTAQNSVRIVFLAPAIEDFLVELTKTKRLNRLEEDVLTNIHSDTMLAQLKLDGLMFDHVKLPKQVRTGYESTLHGTEVFLPTNVKPPRGNNEFRFAIISFRT